MNQIMIIRPYWKNGTWCFTDEAVGLRDEPFVSGIPAIINLMVKDIPDAGKGFKMLFSGEKFPDFTDTLLHQESEEAYGGNWYYHVESGLEGWLCPALFKYFEKAPEMLYAKAEAL